MTTGEENGSGMIRPTAWPSHKPAVEVRHRCEVVATTREGVLDQLVEILSAEGYFVSKKVLWEKVGDFRKRLGLAHEAFHKILRSPICPPVELHRGSARKQILAVCSNPVFEAFCLTVKGKSPTRDPNAPRKKWKQKTVAEGRPSRRKPAHLLKRPRYRRYQTAEERTP